MSQKPVPQGADGEDDDGNVAGLEAGDRDDEAGGDGGGDGDPEAGWEDNEDGSTLYSGGYEDPLSSVIGGGDETGA